MTEFSLSLHAECDGNLLVVPLDEDDVSATVEELCVTYLVPMQAELMARPHYLRRKTAQA